MPDPTLSDALAEAYASAPDVPTVHTLEFRHETLTEPIRLALWNSAWTAYLEADAPANPGEEVTFAAYRLDFKKPKISSDGVPVMSITIDNISRVIGEALGAATQSASPVQMTYREYLPNDTSGPQNDPPIHMEILSVTCDVFRITAQAGFPDLLNRKFPTLEYTAEEFPGLVS